MIFYELKLNALVPIYNTVKSVLYMELFFQFVIDDMSCNAENMSKAGFYFCGTTKEFIT